MIEVSYCLRPTLIAASWGRNFVLTNCALKTAPCSENTKQQLPLLLLITPLLELQFVKQVLARSPHHQNESSRNNHLRVPYRQSRGHGHARDRTSFIIIRVGSFRQTIDIFTFNLFIVTFIYSPSSGGVSV